MRQNAANVVLFLLLAGSATALWWYADRNWFPKQDRPIKTPAEKAADQAADQPTGRPPAAALAAVAGAAVTLPPPLPVAKVEPKAEPKPPSPPPEPPTLIAFGGPKWYNQVLLTTRGGGVQQVVIPAFEEADRIGRAVKDGDTPVRLHLLPGVRPVRRLQLEQKYEPPGLVPGKVTDPETLARMAEPAYTLFHYATPDDKYPDPLLGTTNWRVVEEARPDDGPHKVVFEAELPAPHLLKVRKTFTLGPKDYHIGLKVEFERLPGGQKGRGATRFQVSGPRALPVEGEWYANTTRTVLVGWENPKGRAMRQYEDAATITNYRGGERVNRADNTFKYAAVATQFFTSGLAVDPAAGGAERPWDYVRATSEVYPLVPTAEETKRLEELSRDQTDPLAQAAAAEQLARFRAALSPRLPELEDVTVRAVTDPIDLAAGDKPVVHTYAVYNGPTKVMLLRLLKDDPATGVGAVDPKLVDAYLNRFGLRTLTDYQSPTFIGAFAYHIYWTDLVIFFTNTMHWFLGGVHSVFGSWGWSIIVLTVLVRLALFLPSRKQTAMNMKMVEVQKRLKPELDKLHEKYKDDFQTYNREKTKLLMQHGFNPFAMMGGCLLLFAQMPMIMGLYFCLQESVYFRLEPFWWFPNLAAPDMTVDWGEGVPVISDPANRAGSLLSFLYLGPFLNVLPLVAVGLMLYQQVKMMPPPTDEQMAAQQRMMKVMMIAVAVMFYKSPAGLALYFIISTGWGITERQLIPKPKLKDEPKPGPDGRGGGPDGKGGPPPPPKPKGMLGRLAERARERMEELQKQAAEQSSRQARNPHRGDTVKNPDRPDGDRKKKRRK